MAAPIVAIKLARPNLQTDRTQAPKARQPTAAEEATRGAQQQLNRIRRCQDELLPKAYSVQLHPIASHRGQQSYWEAFLIVVIDHRS